MEEQNYPNQVLYRLREDLELYSILTDLTTSKIEVEEWVLVSVKNLINIAAARGLFQGSEIRQAGELYDYLEELVPDPAEEED